MSLQFADIMAKRARSTANPDVQSKRDRIQSWLLQERWTIKELHDPQAAWIVEAKNPIGIAVIVVQPIAYPDQIIIQGSVNFDDATQATLAAMSSDDRRNLIWDMRFGLLNLTAGFENLSEPLKLVTVNKVIYSDGLTKDAFLQRAAVVNNAVLFIIWSVQRVQLVPPEESSLVN